VLPIKDNVPTRTFPLVTVSLIAVNVVVWLWEWRSGVNSEVLQYGYYPCSLDGPCVSPASTVNHVPWYEGAFTSMFLHGSWIHIGGNMLFLWIFGNNIEDRVGRRRFLFFYLLGGLAASALQLVVGPASDVPNIGASGAIAAVLGGYLLLYPTAAVITFIPPFFFFPLPAVFFLVGWFLLQVFAASSVQVGSAGGGVAYFAHIGGFAFGLFTIKWWVRRDTLRPAF